LQFVDALHEILAPANLPITLKLQRALHWLNLVRRAPVEQLEGTRVTEFLRFISEAASNTVPDELAALPAERPSSTARLLFRLLAAYYARKGTLLDLNAGMQSRLQRLSAILRFTRGSGTTPPVHSMLQPVPFRNLEQPFGMPEGAEQLWARYYSVKLQGLHFCGLAYHGQSFVEGFQNLALFMPAVMWIARWMAGSEGRGELELKDVESAIMLADQHCGHSRNIAVFASRFQILGQSGEIMKLLRWYGR